MDVFFYILFVLTADTDGAGELWFCPNVYKILCTKTDDCNHFESSDGFSWSRLNTLCVQRRMKEEKWFDTSFYLNRPRPGQTRTRARIRLAYNTSLCGYRFIFNGKKKRKKEKSAFTNSSAMNTNTINGQVQHNSIVFSVVEITTVRGS